MLEQCVPARIGLGYGAAASGFIEVGPASRAQSFAIFPALNISRNDQQPVLPDRWAKIQHSLVRVVEEDIGIVRLFSTGLGQQQMDVLIDLDVDLFQAKPAWQLDASLNPTRKIEPSFASRRQSASHADWFCRQNIARFPDWIVRLERPVHVDGFGLERTNVEGQHKPFKLAGLWDRFQ